MTMLQPLPLFGSEEMESCATESDPPLSLEDHPANQLQQQVNDLVAMIADGSGLSSCVWLAKLDQFGQYRRTREGFQPLMEDVPSEEYSGSCPAWGIVWDGELGALPTLEHRTKGSGSSSSATTQKGGRPGPTPTTPNGGRMPKGGAMSDTGMTPDGHKRQVDLAWMVRQQGREWPTPTATCGDGRGEQDVEVWEARAERTKREKGIHNGMPLNVAAQLEERGGPRPTPTVQDAKNNAGQSQYERNSAPLNVAAMEETGGPWPTPRATDATNGGPNQRGSKGDLMLPSAVAQEDTGRPGPTPRACTAMEAMITADAVDKAHERFPNMETVLAQEEGQKAIGLGLSPEWTAQLMGVPSWYFTRAGRPAEASPKRTGKVQD